MHGEYITIFGVTPDNYKYLKKYFSFADPEDETPQDKKPEDENPKDEKPPFENWISVKVSEALAEKFLQQKKLHLKNNDVIFIREGKYKDDSNQLLLSPISSLPPKAIEQKDTDDVMIYKMPKVDNLAILSYESKSSLSLKSIKSIKSIKMREFIFGQYYINAKKDSDSDSNNMNENNNVTILLLPLIFLLIVFFVYKIKN